MRAVIQSRINPSGAVKIAERDGVQRISVEVVGPIPSCGCSNRHFGRVAQLGEQRLCKPKDVGSNPTVSTVP